MRFKQSIKTIVRGLLSLTVQNDIAWLLINPFVRLAIAANNIRRHKESNKKEAPLKYLGIVSNLIVQKGPFKSLKYPSTNSVGSEIIPKLLGVYESELHSVFQRIKDNNYSKIINVGCAEGYYAVGLAQMYKSTKVCAYDLDNNARQLCLEMAKLNGVEDQLEIKSKCSSQDLLDLPSSSKALIVCDCEGFERELFNRDNVPNLANCDLIIETHDFIDIGVSKYLKGLFDTSHTIESIYSTDDIQRVLNDNNSQLVNFDLSEKFEILREKRPFLMEWLVCLSKK